MYYKTINGYSEKVFSGGRAGAGEFANIKVKAMKFTIKKYYARGIGKVVIISVITTLFYWKCMIKSGKIYQ